MHISVYYHSWSHTLLPDLLPSSGCSSHNPMPEARRQALTSPGLTRTLRRLGTGEGHPEPQEQG